MDSDDKFWVYIASIIAVSLVTLILGLTYLHNQKLNMIMTNGYEETTRIGSSETIWQKVR